MHGGEETIDELRNYGLRVVQPRHGYRFSLDPLLLCAFAEPVGEGRVADLGTGCGIIPLVIARRDERAQVVGIEQQEALAELATRNVLLNGLADRITILHRDVTELRGLFPASSFDAVVANPPYRRRGTGKVSPKEGRDNARHESTAGLADFLAVAKYLVKPTGRIRFIYHPSRLGEVFAEASLLKLAPLRLRMVHGNRGAAARMFLVELVKGRRGELEVLPPLFVYGEDGGYSDEMRGILGEGEG
jgi:tRNA1Val (adenine37-N6)-methyltransferase